MLILYYIFIYMGPAGFDWNHCRYVVQIETLCVLFVFFLGLRLIRLCYLLFVCILFYESPCGLQLWDNLLEYTQVFSLKSTSGQPHPLSTFECFNLQGMLILNLGGFKILETELDEVRVEWINFVLKNMSWNPTCKYDITFIL